MPAFLSIRSLALGLALGVSLVGVRRGTQAASGLVTDPLALTGEEWDGLSGDERDAYLKGFLAGAATQQAVTASPRAPGRAIATRALALRRRDALTFPFRENVYRAHLDDYFFYRDRRAQTLIEAMVDASAGIQRGQPR